MQAVRGIVTVLTASTPSKIFETQEENMAPVCIQAVHTTIIASHKFFTASNKHRMITHRRPSMHFCS